jgi:uncharacterized protein YcfJ
MKLSKLISISLLILGSLSASGCSTWHKLNNGEKGAVIGGGSGAVVGSAIAPGPAGTIVGGALGAVGGGLIGNEVDKDGHRRR